MLCLSSCIHHNYEHSKLKAYEPFGSLIWPNLLRYRAFAVDHYSGMPGALHIRPNKACNF
jgi:hypothetical protein